MLMKAKYGNSAYAYVDVTVTDVCPNCGRGIEPILKDSSFYKDGSNHILFLTLFCNSCKYAWVDSYNYLNDYGNTYPRNLHHYKEQPSGFPKEISNLSPQGVKTYTQSLQAEADGYDTLVGIGLRKSLEFIVKDFLIQKFPEKADEIKKKLLGQVIIDYINDPILQKLAQATSWIGNDETHYVRRHTDKDLQDLKKFLNATIRYIEYQLTILDAQNLVDPL
ncbi:DUF4145 domain-containing protein [Streptococcus parasanguinis]|uniref:DUF4145 domain-containing protein n=1 Tax=Streptococcus parasanguinis TaxID=1318 RepID=UPI0012BD1E45|nr:DUF4145 domain-containing protein [Streptococcus parasanguinis]MTS09290.1 DUF4145 domain-containing protein [Streptococcus parasanguinis]